MGNERYSTTGTAVNSETSEDEARHDANPDPMASGVHPVGTGVGAASGAVAGAAIGGAVGGPLGAVVGTAVGGVAGALAGKGVAEAVVSASQTGYSHEDYRPAYWYGWEAAQEHSGRNWVDIASNLERGWDQAREGSKLSWKEAEPAVREAWGQAGSLQGRSKPSLAVPLQQLHDPRTGLLDASRIAEYLELPLKQLSGALGRNYSTVHRTPTASAIQETLRSIKRSLEILEEVLGDKATVLAWWNSPHPDLGRRTPMQVLLEGHAQAIEDMLEAALEGIPS